MNVLVVAPHPDDETIGCGGAIMLHRARGDHVEIVFLTSGELGLKHLPAPDARQVREAEARRAVAELDVADCHFLRLPDWELAQRLPQAAAQLAPFVARAHPRAIYLPHAGDAHPDHRATLPAVRTALRGSADASCALFAYEVWTPLPEFDRVEDITPVMARKLAALRCYRSQLAQFRYDRAAHGLNQYRGALAGRCRFAEVFAALPPT